MNFAKTGALLFLPCALSACAHLATDEAPPQSSPVAEVSAPVAPAPKPIDFDDALARTTKAYDSTGMVAAVSKDGETIWQGARGLAEEGFGPDDKRPRATPRDPQTATNAPHIVGTKRCAAARAAVHQ